MSSTLLTPDKSVMSALKNSLYPGAKDESVMMVYEYCVARQLDPLLKPVHIVPMYVEDKKTGQKGMRDVVMPGIGLYRIQADRSGNYAGMSAPCFGPDIQMNLGGAEICVPEWCEITVSKLIGERIVGFTAREYWVENYATASKDSQAPNAMWKKRPRAQLVKCTEAQALRKAWPELGAQPTAEEMEGKEIDITSISDIERQPVDSISHDDISELRIELKKANYLESDFLRAASINSFDEMPASRLSGAIAHIKNKAKRAKSDDNN